MNRRNFINYTTKAAGAATVMPHHTFGERADQKTNSENPRLKLSLAQWSLRQWLDSGKISSLDFPKVAKTEFGIDAVEYVSTFLGNKRKDTDFFLELKKRTEGENVENVLIMVDMHNGEGLLAHPVRKTREKAAQDHHKWIDKAKYLGCHAIRVNARGYGNAGFSESKNYFADGLSRLVDYGKTMDISVLVENHGGYSSNGHWLAQVMKEVNDDFCGTLPDFGNFRIDTEQGLFYDALVGLSELMPFAKGVSAKAHQFDMNGNETTIDYNRMLHIVKVSDFNGHIGIEWGGHNNATTSPKDGVLAIKNILTKNLNGFIKVR